ncbi:MAG TPA: carboxypeptidase-like regulatory domain-containing protein [Patescibacteria group bacterium]|nr:carboxypeptidase-like regulatory domain-containing protein [Patescibacteria group bacterium]
MRLRALLPALLLTMCFSTAAAAAATARGGRVGGIVLAQGTPQLGANVIVTPEGRPGQPMRLETNRRGVFTSMPLLPGAYSVRVRLAGFLPAFESRILVAAGQITLLRIELGSLFSSVDRLSRDPIGSRRPAEWNWVLRSATIRRPVLRFSHGRVTIGADPGRNSHLSHGRAELIAGSLSSWSPADPQPLGSTAFLYDHSFSPTSRLLIAGSVGYQHATASAVSATWVRSADAEGNTTNSTTVIFRESQLGPGGPSFRGVEIDSRRKMRLGDRVEIDYGGQFVFAALGDTASAARPEARLRVKIDPAWTASLRVSSSPASRGTPDPSQALNIFPTPVESAGRLVFDRPWHEEIALDHPMKGRGALSAAIFHDSNAHTAIFGRGSLAGPNTIADPYSDAFVYDGGSLGQWGARVGYTENLSSHWHASLVYAWSKTLAPGTGDLTTASLRDMIEGQHRVSVGGRVSGRVERTGTELAAAYQWIDGPILSRPDPFGAALYGIDPYLNISVRQPLPNFFCCRIVAIVDVRNLFAQGYVSLETGEGSAVIIPAARAIRGGFAVQF